ncbi:MAG: D-glycero-beta-D-manno-heptose-7-phosphate kinase [Deltaproteobacteria bacterium]
MTTQGIDRILGRFPRTRVLVVGDILLDEFIWGKAERISPEAPVPVVWAQERSYMPGGASNVANNIAALKGQVVLCGVVGEDGNAETLCSALRARGVDTDGVLADAERPTTVKTRIVAQHQQVVRVDWEKTHPLAPAGARRLLGAVERNIEACDAVIIEDYGKGVVTPFVLKSVIGLARRRRKIITVDPKVEHFAYYKGITAMTPNEKEAAAGAGIGIKTDADVDRVGRALLKKSGAKGVLVTLGEKGMKLFAGGRITHIPTMAQEVFDVSGAGDTVIAVFTLALAARVRMEEAARLANAAAGIVVGKVGVAVVTPGELRGVGPRLKKGAL